MLRNRNCLRKCFRNCLEICLEICFSNEVRNRWRILPRGIRISIGDQRWPNPRCDRFWIYWRSKANECVWCLQLGDQRTRPGRNCDWQTQQHFQSITASSYTKCCFIILLNIELEPRCASVGYGIDGVPAMRGYDDVNVVDLWSWDECPKSVSIRSNESMH